MLDVLDLFLGGGTGHTLTDVSARLGMPKSTAHGILHAMRRRGYLTWDPSTKAYAISLQLVGRTSAAPVMELVRLRARRHLEQLAASLGETAKLVGYEGDHSVAVDFVEGPRPLKYAVKLGQRWPLHATGGGKLYLARYTDAEVREMLGHLRLEPVTTRTIVDVEALLQELGDVRRAGWARQREEILDDVSGFAAPVLDAAGGLLASLVVTGPTARMDEREATIVAALVQEAQALSEEIGAIQPAVPPSAADVA